MEIILYEQKTQRGQMGDLSDSCLLSLEEAANFDSALQ